MQIMELRIELTNLPMYVLNHEIRNFQFRLFLIQPSKPYFRQLSFSLFLVLIFRWVSLMMTCEQKNIDDVSLFARVKLCVLCHSMPPLCRFLHSIAFC